MVAGGGRECAGRGCRERERERKESLGAAAMRRETLLAKLCTTLPACTVGGSFVFLAQTA